MFTVHSKPEGDWITTNYATVGAAVSGNSWFFGSGEHGTAGDNVLGVDVVLATHWAEPRNGEWALQADPAYANAHSNRGNVLRDLLRPDEALESFERARQRVPDHADAHWNEGLCRLLMGDFAAGWPLYEWRWKDRNVKTKLRGFSEPLWLGADTLKGKTILLHAEQGLGDTIQFCRYARLVGDLGANVLLEAPQALIGLFEGLAGVGNLVETGKPLPAFDLHCPLMSLPLAFGTTMATIPSECGYLAVPDERRAAIILAGDDHGTPRGTLDSFERLVAESPIDCRPEAWECLRATSYVTPNTPLASASSCTALSACRPSPAA